MVRLPVTAEWDAVVRVLQNTFGREVYFSWADEEEIVVVRANSRCTALRCARTYCEHSQASHAACT